MLDKWNNMLEDIRKLYRAKAVLEWHKDTLKIMKGELAQCQKYGTV